jgi:hypothetical protein
MTSCSPAADAAADRELGWRLLAWIAVAALPLGVVGLSRNMLVFVAVPWIGIAIAYGLWLLADQRRAQYPKPLVSWALLALVSAGVCYHWSSVVPAAAARGHSAPSTWLLAFSAVLLATAACLLIVGTRRSHAWLLDVGNLLSLLALLGPGMPWVGEAFGG